MGHDALRRAAGAGAILAIAALLLGNGLVGTTSALFNGETTNTGSAFAGGWVGAPTAGSVNPLGYDESFAWTVGTHGPVTGQQLWGVNNGTNSNCTGAAYANLATMASASTATYTDANRATLATDGNWWCFELVSTSATVWTAPFILPATQIGLVTNAVVITNHATALSIRATDTIQLTFNQRTNLTAANVRVCVFSAQKTILIGDTTGGCNNSGDATSVGKLVTTGTIGGNATWATSTVVLGTNTMTITLAGAGPNQTVTAGTWTFTPAATIKSNATTDQATMCTAATTNCQPTTTSNF